MIFLAVPPQAIRTASSKSLTGTGALHQIAVSRGADHIIHSPAVGRELGDIDDLLHIVNGGHALRHPVLGIGIQNTADGLVQGIEFAVGDKGAIDGDGVCGEPEHHLLVRHSGIPRENNGMWGKGFEVGPADRTRSSEQCGKTGGGVFLADGLLLGLLVLGGSRIGGGCSGSGGGGDGRGGDGCARDGLSDVDSLEGGDKGLDLGGVRLDSGGLQDGRNALLGDVLASRVEHHSAVDILHLNQLLI